MNHGFDCLCVTENEDAIFKLILTSDVVFMSETWKSISLPAKDLIQKMLIRNPLKRPTAREALSEPSTLVHICNQ